jgi:hypothetical protein
MPPSALGRLCICARLWTIRRSHIHPVTRDGSATAGFCALALSVSKIEGSAYANSIYAAPRNRVRGRDNSAVLQAQRHRRALHSDLSSNLSPSGTFSYDDRRCSRDGDPRDLPPHLRFGSDPPRCSLSVNARWRAITKPASVCKREPSSEDHARSSAAHSSRMVTLEPRAVS